MSTALHRLSALNDHLTEFSPVLYRVEPTKIVKGSGDWLAKHVPPAHFAKFKSEQGRLFADNLAALKSYGHGNQGFTTYKVAVSDRTARKAARAHPDGFTEYLLPKSVVRRKAQLHALNRRLTELARGDWLARTASKVVGAPPATTEEKWDRVKAALPRQGFKPDSDRFDGKFNHRAGAQVEVGDAPVYTSHDGRVWRGREGDNAPHELTVEKVTTPKNAHGKGAGSRGLDSALVAADRAGVTTRLEPTVIKPLAGKGSLTQKRLTDWYKSRGYTPTDKLGAVLQRSPGPGLAAARGSRAAVGQARWLREIRRVGT
jgi:hypothetical protein